MKVELSQDGGDSVTLHLQDDDVGFGFSNNYDAPFDTVGGGPIGAAISYASGGSSKFQYMFNQFWSGATPPELTLNMALIAETAGASVKADLNKLVDMFSTDTQNGQFIPPGGMNGLGLSGFAELAAALATGDDVGAILENSFQYRRLVSVVIGGSLNFPNLLPERIEVKGKLPLLIGGDFAVALVTCTFKKPNIIIKGQPFLT